MGGCESTDRACGDTAGEGVPKEKNPCNRMQRRVLALRGCSNFRDLGGYKDGRGRFVRWGTVYRSDALTRLAWEEGSYLRQLQLSTIIDLRPAKLADRSPVRHVPPEVALVRIPIESSPDRTALAPGRLEPDPERRGREARAQYRQFVAELAEPFGQVLRTVADPTRRPVLLMSSGGKDRAGWASALVLLVLEIPVKLIREDFLLSNQCLQNVAAALVEQRKGWLDQPSEAQLGGMQQAAMEYFGVEQVEFDAAMAELLRLGKGSATGYLRDYLGVTEDMQKMMRQDVMNINQRDLLIAQQDAEYQEALAIDQARDRQLAAQAETSNQLGVS